MKGMYFLLIVSIVLFSCVASKKSASANLSGNWELTVFPSGSKTFTEMFGERKPALQFDMPNHRVSGTTGCNRLNGAVAIHQDQMGIKNMATTKMACDGYDENTFLDALTKVNRYTIQGNQLRLMLDSTMIMAFEKR